MQDEKAHLESRAEVDWGGGGFDQGGWASLDFPYKILSARVRLRIRNLTLGPSSAARTAVQSHRESEI